MYVDGFVLAVPAENREKFIRQAREAAAVFLEHGATRVVENWGDDVPVGKLTDFHGAVKREGTEVVLFSWIEYPDRETRDRCQKLSMEDPRMSGFEPADMAFNAKTMIFGGFANILGAQ